MKRILKIILAVIFLASIVPGISSSADGTAENLSTYTEVNPTGFMTVNDTTVNVYGMPCSGSDYVYYDFGAGYFGGNFILDYSLQITYATALGIFYPVILSNALGSWATINNGGESSIGLRILGDANDTSLQQTYTGAGYQSVPDNSWSLSTQYYCRLKRDESVGTYGTLYHYWYSDAARTILVDTQTLTIAQGSYDYQYLMLATSYGSGATGAVSCLVSDVYVYNGAGAPAIVNNDSAVVSYNTDIGMYYVTVSANLTDDGSANTTVTYYYKNDTEGGEWEAGVMGGYQSIGAVDMGLWLAGNNTGDTYSYYARAVNDYGTANSATKTFSLSTAEAVPDIQTLSYPLTYSAIAENLTGNVTIWGRLMYDGGLICDGWFWYRVIDTGDWIMTEPPTTSLETGDYWSYEIPNIPVNTEYEYRASANNTQGTVNGTIGTFELIDVDEPILSTDNATSVTSFNAILSGRVIDDGGDRVQCTLEYRKAGNPLLSWLVSPWAWLETGETMYYQCDDLSPSTTYEYRIKGFNYWHIWGEGSGYTYGETKTFTTVSFTGIPVLNITDYGYLTDYSIYVFGEVLDDGGDAPDVWFQYREVGSSIWLSNAGTITSYGVAEGYEVTHYIQDVTYGQKYELQMVGENSYGIGYSTAVSFHFVTEDDTTTPEPSNLVPGLNSLLGQIGLDSEGGHLFFIIGLMVVISLMLILSPGRRLEEMARFTVPIALGVDCLIFVFGLIIGYIPTLVTVGVIIAAAGTIGIFVVKLFRGRGGSVAV